MNKKCKGFLSVALFGIASTLLIGCNGNSNNDKPQENEPKENEPKENEPTNPPESEKMLDADITLKSVESDFETHTSIQKEYFTNNDYKTLPSGANGRTSNDKPNSLSLSWTIDAKEEVKKASLLLGEDEGLSNPIEYDLTVSEEGEVQSSKEITNLKVSTKYYWAVKLEGTETSKTSDVSSFSTLGNGPRFINIDGVANVRDIGGWTTESGKTLKQGLIYRGGEFNKQNYGKTGTKYDADDAVERAKEKPYGKNITDKGVDTVLNELKLKTEIDVRGYENYEYIDQTSPEYLNPSPVEIGGLKDGRGIILELQYIVNPIHTNHDKIYKTDGGKAAVKKFFTTLADEKNYPVYFHCAQGKDRTGFIGYVLEGLLGMKKEDMCRDFVTSNFSNVSTVSLDYFLNKTNPKGEGSRYDYGAYFDGYKVADMDQLTGSTMQERVSQYLLSCGLTQQQLDKIIEINVEK